jgi:phage FluMu protein Com
MGKIKEVRCGECGDLLFKIIDEEYIEIVCGRKGHKTLWKIPKILLTNYKEPNKLYIENIKTIKEKIKGV